MKKIVLLLAATFAAFSFAFAQLPVLGTYPATTIITGGNTLVNPASAPAGTNSITALTVSRFKGQLFVNPVTGAVRIVNAYPAGTYTIVVKAFGSTQSSTTSFTLTVATPSEARHFLPICQMCCLMEWR